MINIYLDSHHISRIAEGKSDLERFLPVDVRRYFSQSHVIEALPKSTLRVDASISRLRLITERQGFGLLPWTRILELEIAREGKLSFDEICCPISEILFYGLDSSEFGKRSHCLKTARNLIDEKLTQIPDPNQRRSMRAKLFKRGKFSPIAIEFLREQQRTVAEAVSKSLPEMLPLFEKGGMYDFLCGKVSEQRYSSLFLKIAGNPVVLANLAVHPEFDFIMDISKFLWKETDRIAEHISVLIQKLVALQKNLDFVPPKILRSKMIKLSKVDNFRIQIASILTNKTLNPETLSKLPGTSLFVDCMIQYIQDKIDTYANITSPSFGREIAVKSSDFADLTHLFYSPYVDIFGCDGDTKQRVQKLGYQTTQFASNDADFVQKINELRLMKSKET